MGVTRLRVSARSSPNAVAGAIAGVMRDHGRAEVDVVGAGALNQAIKAAAIARTYLAQQEIDLVCVPSFVDIDIDGEQRTALRLLLEDRSKGGAVADLRVEHDPQAVVTDLRVEPGDTAAATDAQQHRPAAT